jgi:hypothetical protein
MNLSNGGEVTVQRVDLFSRIDEARALLCSFFWSDEFGLRCSAPAWLHELEVTGVATPAGKVYPTEGRRFFDALQVLVLSVVEITAPRPVPVSEVCTG